MARTGGRRLRRRRRGGFVLRAGVSALAARATAIRSSSGVWAAWEGGVGWGKERGRGRDARIGTVVRV